MSANPSSLLVVDDDGPMREMLVSLFRERGFLVAEADSAAGAIAELESHEYDVVLSDIRMPGRSGIELVGEVRRLRPGVPVILMTAFGSIDSAIEAMRVGAFDYITKPFEPEAVQVQVERALERRALEVENRRLRRAVDRTAALGDLLGASPAMREIFALIRKIAHNRSSVLITGESGTGKEVVARTIHYHGERAAKAFVPINCTAIPEGLLESELFGHVRGAFTGAHASKRGLFEEAHGGTLFLDEIGDLSPGLQAKLLRVLQDQQIRPVGGNQAVDVDARIIAATNKDLEALIEAGTFREDLFYRLNVIPVHIPPLRERPEDIPLLVEAYLPKHAGDRAVRLLPDAMALLQRQPWKGNARELENVLERALVLADSDEIDAADIPLGGGSQRRPAATEGAPLRAFAQRGVSMRELEEAYTAAVLEMVGGNKARAAKLLGIDRKTLYRRAERKAGDS